MVYCGKPSKGCQACRERNTRCDLQTPSCSQCIRGARACPGYRNQLDLMFRNENNAVIVKAKIKKKPNAKPSHSSSSTSSTGSNSFTEIDASTLQDAIPGMSCFQMANHKSLVPASLSPTMKDRGLAFFNSKSAVWLRNFDIVESMCNQSNTSDHLLASMNAVGLASYSTSVHAPELMSRARKDYVTALQLTNLALRSPTEVKKDSTLFSVMALGLFETVAGSNENSLTAWAQHLHGASELVKLRGPEQFRTRAGQHMFFQTTSNLMVDCVQRAQPMPPHIIGLREGLRRFVDPNDPSWKISSYIIDFTILRANIAQRKLVDPRKIVEASLALDRGFSHIFENPPPIWQYKIIHTDENPAMIWNGIYHEYHAFWVARFYNTTRAFRLHIQEIIRDQLQALSLDSSPVFSEAESSKLLTNSITTMQDLQAGILASIPQQTTRDKSLKPNPDHDLSDSNAYFILWPLYLVAVTDITNSEMRTWVINRLRSIGESSGIDHATILADGVVRRQKMELLKKGKYAPKPQKLHNLDWNMDGWAVAHGAILTAQINRKGC